MTAQEDRQSDHRCVQSRPPPSWFFNRHIVSSRPITFTAIRRITDAACRPCRKPEIPPNAGNIARLCAATGTRMHLIGRLGFRMDDRSLQRAGLDYWPAVDLVTHAGWDDFWTHIGSARIVCLSSKAEQIYTRLQYLDGDCFALRK